MAIRDRDIAAEIIGVRPLRTKLLAFAISSFFCGVAGAEYVFLYLGSAETLAFDINAVVPRAVHGHHRRAGQRSWARSWAPRSS